MDEWAGKEEKEEEGEREEGEGVGRVAEVARAVAVHRPSLLGRGKFKIGRLPSLSPLCSPRSRIKAGRASRRE